MQLNVGWAHLKRMGVLIHGKTHLLVRAQQHTNFLIKSIYEVPRDFTLANKYIN